jgi:hypothetical protein
MHQSISLHREGEAVVTMVGGSLDQVAPSSYAPSYSSSSSSTSTTSGSRSTASSAGSASGASSDSIYLEPHELVLEKMLTSATTPGRHTDTCMLVRMHTGVFRDIY